MSRTISCTERPVVSGTGGHPQRSLHGSRHHGARHERAERRGGRRDRGGGLYSESYSERPCRRERDAPLPHAHRPGRRHGSPVGRGGPDDEYEYGSDDGCTEASTTFTESNYRDPM